MEFARPFVHMACWCSLLALAGGCGGDRGARQPAQVASEMDRLCFRPAKIRISPVTELTLSGNGAQSGRIKVCVVLLDEFESCLKAPGTFRFELYERILRSATPKGRRIIMWDDLDLRTPEINNQYWQWVWHAYEFELEFPAQRDTSYILEVTFVSPDDHRLTADYTL